MSWQDSVASLSLPVVGLSSMAPSGSVSSKSLKALPLLLPGSCSCERDLPGMVPSPGWPDWAGAPWPGVLGRDLPGTEPRGTECRREEEM